MKRLNFGCGTDIREGWDNCDIQKGEGVISFDANIFPYKKLKDNFYDYIYLREILPVINEPDKVLFELWKKSKPGCIIEIEVPYHNNKGAVNDMQLKHFFNDKIFEIFVEEKCVINKKKRFEIYELELEPTRIGSIFPRYIRGRLALFIGGLISKVHVKLKVNKK